MIFYKLTNVAIVFICFLLLVACSNSKEDVLVETEENVQEIFLSKEEIKANEEAKGFSYNLPYGFKVETEDEYNLILNKGNQSFILFVNPLEASTSRVVYEATVMSSETEILNKTFENNNSFGFIYVRELEKDLYEVSSGIGGVKMTTQTTLDDLEDSAKSMMEIVKSVNY